MKATRLLQHEHRQFEQALALLEAHDGDCTSELAALIADLAAHLSAEESVLYPAAERALGQTFRTQRDQHARVRSAIAATMSPRKGAVPFMRRLFELTEAFKLHSRLDERLLHASLDGRLRDSALEALGEQIAVFQSSKVASYRP
jgi:hypothetical protein